MIDKVLFIMPSLNRQSIHNAIDSLYKQTDDRWNLCIVYDNTESMKVHPCEKISCINLKTKLGKHKNSAGLVRNVGIDKNIEKYKWIAFLDDDDIVSNEYVNLIFNKYSSYDFVIFRMNIKIKNRHSITIPRSTTNKAIRCSNVGISFCYQSKFRDIRFRASSTEDFLFLKQLEKCTDNFVISDEIGYYVNH